MDGEGWVMPEVAQQEAYEALRQRLRDVEARMHPLKAGVAVLEDLAFVVDALEAVDRGERLPPKPNRPPVAKPGRGRGWTPKPETVAEIEARKAAEAEAAAAAAAGGEGGGEGGAS